MPEASGPDARGHCHLLVIGPDDLDATRFHSVFRTAAVRSPAGADAAERERTCESAAENDQAHRFQKVAVPGICVDR